MSTFLSRILRTESKDKSKSEIYLKTRQFVAPPDWFEAYDANYSVEPQKPSKQPKKNGHDKSNSSKDQKLGQAKSRGRVSSKNSKHNKKRQNKPLASWFCMSGNTDTLERQPQSLPENPNAKKGRTHAKDIRKQNKLITTDNPIARVYIRNTGKKKRDPKLRHSMPAQDWVTIDFKSSQDSLHEVDDLGPVPFQPKRSLSPGVRYRVDGTLERPYVFPSGFTFGPEGRKLKLRRRSETDEMPREKNSSNEQSVQAQVHYASDNQTKESDRYGREYDDVRKEFYLKYDSDSRYSMQTDSSQQFGHYNRDLDTSQNHTANSFVHKAEYSSDTENTQINPGCKQRQSRKARKKNRYSLPPKNEEFVYMGSFENLHILDALSIDDRTVEKRRSGRKKDKRSRYSLPPMNSELVYMGSFENLNHFVNGGNKVGVGFSENIDDSVSSNLPEYQAHCSSETDIRHREPTDGIHVPTGYDTQGFEGSGARPKRHSLGRKAHLQDDHRHSMPEIPMSTHLSVAKSTKSEGNEDSKDEEDFFDEQLSTDFMSRSSKPSPFSRNAGRSSCMPGNKRFEPPPAIFETPKPEEKGNEIVFRSEDNAFVTPWKKRFSLPPPPDCTPPKEEMEKAYARLSGTDCHKGSQANLSLDCESLNMEDRDMSLKRTDATTIYSTMSSSTDERSESLINARRNLFTQQNGNSGNTEQYEVMSPLPIRNIKNEPTFLDLSHESDEVFRDTLSNVSFNSNGSAARVANALISGTGLVSDVGNDYNTMLIYPENKEDTHRKIASGERSQDITSTPALTSTTVVSRRPKVTHLSHTKPVPAPRKRLSLPASTEVSLSSKYEHSNSKTKKPPVPKRRQSTLKAQKVPAPPYENKSPPQSHTNQTPQRKQVNPSLVRETTPSSSKKGEVIYNVYEEIDSQSTISVSHEIGGEHHYEEFGYLIETENKSAEPSNDLDQILPALEEFQLASSPRPQRKMDPQGSESRPLYTGLSSSVADLLDIFDREVEEESRMRGDDDDDDSIADDEMSGCNDEEEERVLKKRSLRKSFSASDLLRSGSILDRSMIQAKKRRHRMRGRKCRSQLFSSTETEDNMDFSSNDTHDVQRSNSGSHNSNYRFSTSQNPNIDQPSNKKLNQTDSGHDSDGMSPCTSPGNQRHAENMAAFVDALKRDDPCSQRGGTLTKKPWQIRLRNKQFMRRSRSRENLASNTRRLEVMVGKCDLDTLV